jgi:hypothetical protein
VLYSLSLVLFPKFFCVTRWCCTKAVGHLVVCRLWAEVRFYWAGLKAYDLFEGVHLVFELVAKVVR